MNDEHFILFNPLLFHSVDGVNWVNGVVDANHPFSVLSLVIMFLYSPPAHRLYGSKLFLSFTDYILYITKFLNFKVPVACLDWKAILNLSAV